MAQHPALQFPIYDSAAAKPKVVRPSLSHVLRLADDCSMIARVARAHRLLVDGRITAAEFLEISHAPHTLDGVSLVGLEQYRWILVRHIRGVRRRRLRKRLPR